ncbi:hypothetical protein M513_05016 [Trichuris suis]|uniref:SAM domain-containing protein n=1 Tax=Trichuris suis TaxID=68888 RepID=A0A085M9V1_9BILA|nr:hypothetical protein M513_05016 [Trichuris suis]
MMKRNSTGTDYGRLPLSSPAVSASGKSQSVVQLRGSGGWFALDEDRPSRSSLSSLDRSSESINRRFSIDVTEMLDNNYSDEDILVAWLDSIGFKQYAANFIDSGYNVQTVSRMTPEDLRAIGITKPDHRMRITAHLKRFVVPDSWPSYRPGLSRTWLYDIGLGEYAGMFESQGYRTVDDLRQLTWEDLEDIGVKKLGHMKRILLASKKLEQTRKERSSSGSASPRATAEIRPYAHMIFGQSPPVHPMVSEGSSNLITFQSSPRKKVSQKKPPIGNASMLSSSFSDTCNTSDAVCNSPYSPFPRRTMAVVHPVPNEQLVNKNSSTRLTSVDCRLNLREMSKSQELASVSHQCLCKSSEDGPLSVRYAGEKRRAQSTSGQSTAASPFRLSTHWDCASDSQLPGADELPPPPTLLCEASIQALRNVWRNPPMQAKAAAAATDDCGQQPVHRIANGNSLNKQNVMSKSVGSVSETMPNSSFSSETNGTACSSSSGKQSGSLLIGSTNVQQRASSRIRSAEGLDDIESMLQNLSDQLDALLIHPAA